MHSDLSIVIACLYDPCQFVLSELTIEEESQEYGACAYRINGKIVKHRASKITPTKVGQFVTIWKRNQQGITQPFDKTDELDFIIITARSEDKLGLFIFPKNVLIEKGIISGNKEGKRGIRVYPPWDNTTNNQASKTQKWQLDYFLEIHTDGSTDLLRAIKLFAE